MIRDNPNCGRANGLFANSIDVFICLAKQAAPTTHSTLRHFFGLLYSSGTSELEGYFSNTYLFCLHKSVTNPDALRPIGIPTAVRRILTSHAAQELTPQFAHHLFPHNYAIGVTNGMDFVV